ncbi:MAG: NAD(P)/FAD-dependent oxidoreductase [Bacteroidetes bacterium]|nr:MAG: NAD(P)/FAD-dependent oxidoreductase [Bacteroidota bacterium]
MIHTDICIIGAGPVGLFAVFEAGLLKMRCHIVDVLPQIGGQLTEIYPKKPIYDIPGFPDILAQDLIKNLRQQIDPFQPTFTLGERVESLAKLEDESFILATSEGTQISCKIVVIAGGLGCFEPRKPPIPNLEKYESGKGIQYMITDPEKFRNKRIVIAGGGDSALDWTNFLADVTSELVLVHRNESFRGAPDSAEKVLELAKEGKIKLLLNSNVNKVHGENNLTSVSIEDKDKVETIYETDYFIPLFGLTPKLGPIADWNLNIDKNAIEVNTLDYSTNIKGIFAIGDINTYEGKLKLILCGFHEAALMAQSAFKIMNPNKKFTMKYTTVNGIETF